MRRSITSILVLTISLSGCSKQATAPAGPPPPPVPELVASQPPARTPSAIYDSDIWAQFDRPLDPLTVTTLNVYLKQDGQRIPITVSYAASDHRVTLRPTVTLALQRTYTVEFSTAVHGADGTPLAPGVFYQFTTNSLRRPAYDFPLAADLEGPLAALGWGGAVGPTNNVVFEVYASTDSQAVRTRSAPFLNRSVFTRYLPDAAWPMGSTIYWALTTENLTTHERLDGEMRSFRILDAGTPLDSISIGARDHGSRNVTNTTQQCNNANFSCGPTFNGALHWAVGSLPADARFQSATVRLTTGSPGTNDITVTQPALWMAQNEWVNCQIVAPGPPFAELSGLLATSVAETPSVARFSSDRLGALLEAQARGRSLLFGTLVHANSLIVFQSTTAGDFNFVPKCTVRFYHLPPPAPRP